MRALMTLGLGLMRLKPEDFWSLTLPEWLAMAEAAFAPLDARQAMTQERLTNLMAAYPDTMTDRRVGND